MPARAEVPVTPAVANPCRLAAFAAALLVTPPIAAQAPQQKPQAVNGASFVRAETDTYFAKTAKEGGFGKFVHRRTPVAIDDQKIIRMNRDTLYSNAVFDLDAGPVTITLPADGKRFMSLLAISQDHLMPEVAYAPGRYTYSKEQIGTRYVQFIVRTFVDPQNPADLKSAGAAQDAIRVEQPAAGKLELPAWDQATLDKARDALLALSTLGTETNKMFGTKAQVDPIQHLIGTAIGWGGNPASAAVYDAVFPKANDGTTVHRLTVKDVPVDGFWSVTVYNAKGFMQKNDFGAYSVNNVSAKPAPDGSVTVQFGGCTKTTANCLPIVKGWNYIVRMYRPKPEVVARTWRFPEAVPVK